MLKQFHFPSTDLAGNTTTTNFNVTLDYSTATNPVVGLTWPTNGMQICGNSFTLRGMLDDDTATVSGQYTDTNGVAQTVGGLVERGGQFWVENVPLNPGTNIITVTARDAAGNSSSTNLTLTQSGVTLTMDAVDANQLHQVYVDVTGEISATNYAVWVNGVQGTNTGDGYWSAANVPVTAGGTASFDMTAYPPAYAPTGNSWTNFTVEDEAYPNPLPADPVNADASEEQQPVVYMQHMKLHWTSFEVTYDDRSYSDVNDLDWTRGSGGYWNVTSDVTNGADISHELKTWTWPGDAGWFPVLDGQFYDYGEDNISGSLVISNLDIGPPDMGWIEMAPSFHEVERDYYSGDIVPETLTESSAQVVELFTGGKALRQARSLFVLGQALFKGEFNPDFGDMGAGGAAIPSQEISLGAYGKEDSDGNAYAVVAYGQNVDISPQTPKPWAGNINLPGAQKWTLTHLTEHQALANPDPNRTTIGVCEHVGLSISGAPPDAVVDWDTSAGGLAVSGSTATFLAPDQPATATITANINGHPLPPLVLNVIRPSGIQFANPPLAKEHLYNCCDAGFHTQVIILPTSVCFYNIDISEMHTNAIADGCYSSFNGSADPHKSWTEQGFGWLQPNDNNNLPTTVDYCEGPPIDPPYSEGHFEWDIPWNYRLHGATDDGYNFKVIHQTTDATSTGKCTTSKANMTVSFEAGDANANW